MSSTMPSHTITGQLDAGTVSELQLWLRSFQGQQCIRAYVRSGEVVVKFASNLDVPQESNLWLTVRYASVALIYDTTVTHTYVDNDDDDLELRAYEDAATAALRALVGRRVIEVSLDAQQLDLTISLDGLFKLVIQPLYDVVPDNDHYWSAILSEEHWLAIGPGRRYVLEHRDDPLPPSPYRPALRVQESVLAGPDRAGRGPFAHEAHADNDLALVQAVLDDLFGQQCISVKVVQESGCSDLMFGTSHEYESTILGTIINGDWTLWLSCEASITLTAADGARLIDGVLSEEHSPALALLVGASVTGAQVHLADLGLTLAFDNSLTLALHPPATPHPPPNPYEPFWRLSGPDRPERMLDVGPGRLVSYLVWPPARGQG